MPPPPMLHGGLHLGRTLGPTVEFIYLAIIIFLCLLVYFKTKEIYDLTSHRGIRYFRNAFFLFGIAYLFRFIGVLSHIYKISFGLSPGTHFILGFVLSAYASSIAILYLAHSVMWKRIKLSKFNEKYLHHVIALGILIIAFVTNSPLIILAAQILLFVFILIMGFINYRKVKKKQTLSLYAIYFGLFLFWILNLFTSTFRFLFRIELFLYVISIALFALIARKVIKNINQK
jgi:hypothetical protein